MQHEEKRREEKRREENASVILDSHGGDYGTAFRVVTAYNLDTTGHFEGIYSFHLQGRRVS
jgi:hypothetical protein